MRATKLIRKSRSCVLRSSRTSVLITARSAQIIDMRLERLDPCPHPCRPVLRHPVAAIEIGWLCGRLTNLHLHHREQSYHVLRQRPMCLPFRYAGRPIKPSETTTPTIKVKRCNNLVASTTNPSVLHFKQNTHRHSQNKPAQIGVRGQVADRLLAHRRRRSSIVSPHRSGAVKEISSSTRSITVCSRRAPMFSTLELTSTAMSGDARRWRRR